MLALTSLAPLRRATMPRFSGMGHHAGVALTYDDGPDPVATPRFLELLAAHDVHGWDHRCVLTKTGRELRAEVQRAAELIEAVTGERPTCRPPYGGMSRALGPGCTRRRLAHGPVEHLGS